MNFAEGHKTFSSVRNVHAWLALQVSVFVFCILCIFHEKREPKGIEASSLILHFVFLLDRSPPSGRRSPSCSDPDSNPCRRGGVCVFNVTRNLHVCRCRKGLRGDLCQEGEIVMMFQERTQCWRSGIIIIIIIIIIVYSIAIASRMLI